MTSAKAPVSPLAALALKLVGTITILASMLDFLVLLIPPDLLNRQWQLATTTQMVDRGIVPLVGIALLLTGYWIESNLGVASRGRSLFLDGRFWVCILASVLGLLFIIFTLLYPNNVRLTSKQALDQISQEATQANTQLEQQFEQQRGQITSLLQNETQLQQAIQSGQISQEQLAVLNQYKGDPEGLNKFLDEQLGQVRQQAQTQIGTRREEAEKRLVAEAWKSAIRIGLSSLLLSIGYVSIGWSGLRRLLLMR